MGTEPKRNRFHSLCPYFAMFPESFVETWVERLTKPCQVVLDPFCGRGTTPFHSLLMGRRAIGCDVNPVAYCISRAKTHHISAAAIRRRVTQLESDFAPDEWEPLRRSTPEVFRVAFSPITLRQVLFLRGRLDWRRNRSDCMIAALLLGALHGESNKSPSYLSNQMPRTISTKPGYSVRFWKRHGYKAPKRDAFELVRRLISFRYESVLPNGNAEIFNEDMRNLPAALGTRRRIGCVITSPPYFDVTNFEEDQWLRLCALGGPPYPTRGRVSRDDRHGCEEYYWRFIADMWRCLGKVLASRAHVVIRIGSRRITPQRLVDGLNTAASFSQRATELVQSEVSDLKNRQTNSFLPGTKGCSREVDCHFYLK